MSKWSVYVMKDPRNGRLYYVGRTTNTKRRLLAHISGANSRRTTKQLVREIRAAGLRPQMKVIASGLTEGVAKVVEKSTIDRLRRDGIELMNSTSDRSSCSGRPTLKKSELHDGRVTTMVHRPLHDALLRLATLDGVTISDIARNALADYVERRS